MAVVKDRLGNVYTEGKASTETPTGFLEVDGEVTFKEASPPPDFFSDSEPGETIEQEARRKVYGDREVEYDSPKNNSHRIALIWEAILGIKVEDWQVALCLNGVKLARLAFNPRHRDGQVDDIGYILYLERILEERDASD